MMTKKLLGMVGAMLLTGSLAIGQRYFHHYPQHAFIEYSQNAIQFHGTDAPMQFFFSKLDQVIFEGKGQVNILHVGGSHIQAGIWSGTIRETLHSLHPGIVAGRGLVFPYRAAKTNGPGDYSSDYSSGWEGCRNVEKNKECNLGLMGISVSTRREDAWLKIVNKPDAFLDYRFTEAVVFHSTDALSYGFTFPNDPEARVETYPEKGYSKVWFSRSLDTLHFQLQRTDSLQNHFSCYGFKLENDRPGIYYNAVGNNGADVPAYLRSVQFAKHLEAAKPDLVVLSIGINDAYHPGFSPEEYKANYRDLIRRIRTQAPHAAILFTTNNDSYYKRRYANPNGAKVKKALEELSAEMNAGLWDMYSIMGGLRSIDTWVGASLAKTDKIHFTGEGYRMIGYLLSSALIHEYEKHLQSKWKN
jgi:lysophospholipase L1-like esterase